MLLRTVKRVGRAPPGAQLCPHSSLACCTVRRQLSTNTSPSLRRTNRLSRPDQNKWPLSCEHSRRYGTTLGNTKSPEIAVLGGGLTGLTTAYYLTIFNPNAKVTVFEAADRLGGWVDAQGRELSYEDGEKHTVTFDRGPRIIQTKARRGSPDEWILYDLVDRLNLNEELFYIPAGAHPLNQRYIYYPDHLVRLPAQGFRNYKWSETLNEVVRILSSWTKESLWTGSLSSVVSQMNYANQTQAARLQLSKLPEKQSRVLQHNLPDESIGKHFAKRFGQRDLVDNVLSAMIHGVYGGDVYKISVEESILARPFLSSHLSRPDARLVNIDDRYVAADLRAGFSQRESFKKIVQSAWDSSYVGMYGSFEELTYRMSETLKANPNVTVKTSSPVEALEYDATKKAIKVSCASKTSMFDKVISSIYSGDLNPLVDQGRGPLCKSEAVSIMLVNLAYKDTGLNLPNFGFGYLLPRSVPIAQNPHAALGVLFDSDREQSAHWIRQASSSEEAPLEDKRGTTLTVMLGGHNWDWLPYENWPSEEEAIKMATKTVELQLGIPAESISIATAKMCRNAIPQHLVGHRAHMQKVDKQLKTRFKGKLAVVGGSYTAPGVLSSLRAARDIALQVAGLSYSSDLADDADALAAASALGEGNQIGDTGLARFNGTYWYLDDGDSVPMEAP